MSKDENYQEGKKSKEKINLTELLRSEISLPKVHTWILESGNKRVIF